MHVIVQRKRVTVGVSDMKLSRNREDEIITYALGSCIAVTIYDPKAGVGGMLHFQLPSTIKGAKTTADNQLMYAETGIPLLFKKAYEMGAEKKRLVVKVAGGGSRIREQDDMFDIGKRNFVYLRKMFWKNQVLISGKQVGGSNPMTMELDMETGRTFVTIKKQTLEI